MNHLHTEKKPFTHVIIVSLKLVPVFVLATTVDNWNAQVQVLISSSLLECFQFQHFICLCKFS